MTFTRASPTTPYLASFHPSIVNHVARCAIIALICTVARADVDPQPYTSPNGAFTAINVGDTAQPDHHFQIRTRDGRVLLSSDSRQPLEYGSFATSIRWSPDSRFVAFSVRASGPYIHDTFIYSVRSSELLRVPTDDDDYQTRPVHWPDARTVIVQTDAPFGGKATAANARSSYRYRRTIRVSESPLRHDTLYTTKRTHPTQ
jgi:hypothetical protein